MIQTIKDIKAAKELIKRRNKDPYSYIKYSSSFLFGTENQAGIDTVMPYKDKDIATVASSGDQYLGAVYFGGKTVDIFDINRMTYFVTCLKIAAVYILDYKEFLDFFMPYDSKGNLKKSFFDLNVLKRLLPIMPIKVGLFWDRIMFDIKKFGLGDLFPINNSKYNYEHIKRGMPFYQSEEEYFKLQRLLRKRAFPKFYEADVRDLGKVLTSNYDIVYLSNIIECLVCTELYKLYYPSPSIEEDFEHEFTREILNSLKSLLRDDTTIMLDYRPNRSLDQSCDWLFNNPSFVVHEISSKYPPNPSLGQSEYTDLVLTYKPKKSENGFNL